MPYGLPLLKGGSFQAALDQAVSDAKAAGSLGPSPEVAFSIILLSKTGSHQHADFLGEEMFFSASVLKIAAMYSAFELRNAVKKFAFQNGKSFASETDFFQALVSEFDPDIEQIALPEVQNTSKLLGDKFKADGFSATPAYQKIFSVNGFGSPGGLTVTFKASDGDKNEFAENLSAMIRISGDEEAREVIKALSYSYINAALIKGGFFDPSTMKGIWLGGDFSFGADPFLDFHLGQNSNLAQVTTANQVSKFFALVMLGQLISKSDSQEMKDHLTYSVKSWLTYVTPKIKDFYATMRKVGLANKIRSEGALIQWMDMTKFYAKNFTADVAVCWQNLKEFGTVDKRFNGVADVIRQTVTSFLGIT